MEEKWYNYYGDNMDKIRERINDLILKINQASYEYYVNDNPTIKTWK